MAEIRKKDIKQIEKELEELDQKESRLIHEYLSSKIKNFLFKNKARYRLYTFKLKKFVRYIKLLPKIYRRRIKLEFIYNRKSIIIKISVIFVISTLILLASLNKTKIVDKSTHTVEYKDTTNTLEKYLYILKIMESNGNHLARRKYMIIDKSDKGEIDTNWFYSEYIGYYQLGRSARKAIGFDKYTSEQYWKSPELQEKSIIIWLKLLKKELQPEIDKYNGKFIGTYYITESGLIAMAHLCGSEGVKSFLRSNGKYIPRDGNNKPGVDYLQQLGRFDLKLNKK